MHSCRTPALTATNGHGTSLACPIRTPARRDPFFKIARCARHWCGHPAGCATFLRDTDPGDHDKLVRRFGEWTTTGVARRFG
jgi:hypothetical protein